ncbi:MAG: hypothetical protein ACI83D_000486 [Planctomycetota bacterium]|jgi:hypothetical protein
MQRFKILGLACLFDSCIPFTAANRKNPFGFFLAFVGDLVLGWNTFVSEVLVWRQGAELTPEMHLEA